MQTDRFSLTIGSNNQDVKIIWQELVERFNTETGIYIKATVDETVVIYPKKAGCPEGGEKIYRITGTRNTKNQVSFNAWSCTVLHIANELRGMLTQTTAQIEFDSVNLIYLKD